MAMRSLHRSVPQYVRCWLPGANQDKLRYFEVFILSYFILLCLYRPSDRVREKKGKCAGFGRQIVR